MFVKNCVRHTVELLVGVCCLTVLLPVWARALDRSVTPDFLQSRLAAAQGASELDEDRKNRLVDLYRQSIGNLEAARGNRDAAEEYRQSLSSAPDEAAKVRARIERRRANDPTANLQISPSATSDDLARKLDEEIANLAAVEAKLALLEARLGSEAQRPALIRNQIAAARSQAEGLASQLGDRLARDESPQFEEATRLAAETRLEAFQAEIVMLDQELLSYGARNELLKAQRDEAAQSASRITQRIDVLREAVSERRRIEAELPIAQARAALEGASADEPLMRELAEENLSLVELLQAQVAQLDELAARERERPRGTQIDNAFRSARRRLELEDSSAPVGLSIIERRRKLPSVREYTVERRRLSRSITAVSLRLIEFEEERRALRDASAYTDERIAEAGRELLDDFVRKELEELVRTHRSLLDQAIANDNVLRRRLYDLDDALQLLTDKTAAYDAFLAERLLWVRSTKSVNANTLAELPGEVTRYLVPGPWLETFRLSALRLVKPPIYLPILLLAAALVWRRKRIRRALVDCGRNVGSIRSDTMQSTFKAVVYTLLLAMPAPLILIAVGRALVTADDAETFASVVGAGLLRMAPWLFFYLSLRALFETGGVADRHFGWDRSALNRLRGQLAWFVALTFSALFVLLTSVAVENRPANTGGALTLFAFVVVMVGFIALMVGVGHPTKGSAQPMLASRSRGALWRWQYLWFPITVLLPTAVIALELLGFAYTAQALVRPLFQSIAFLTVVWLATALLSRWLLMTSRRLAFEESITARARQSGESGEAAEGAVGEDDIGAPEVDLVALDTDSRKLMNATVLLLAVLGLAGIWGDFIPALRVLDDIDLWSKIALVDGAERVVPVTLADLLLAAIIGIGGYILAANLPSLIDIILLKYGSANAGSRYTVETLTRYSIVAFAVVLMLRPLGANASQLGWAAAALGVGIGFGLQEIVANFICGLILLFERPVRIGDVITVGDASGTVSKIRIRAITLRDWEQKELVIPNKELITGRVLNWTLSDEMTRLFISVGVAYGSDVDRAMALIMEVAEQNDRILADPEPRVHFEEFADSSLNLTLRAYVGAMSDRLLATTELHKAIDQKFRAAGIVIAFPQRDVHLYTGDPTASAPGGEGGGKER
jgi:potassium efflux system protein